MHCNKSKYRLNVEIDLRKSKQKYYERSIPDNKFIDKIAFKNWKVKIFFLNNYN